MKKTIKKLAYLLIAFATLQSCSDWLEATSSTQVSDVTLFSSRSGFQDALCGVYISMGDQKEYGEMWTWFVNELAYGPYASQYSPVFTAIQTHDWESTSINSTIASMWQSGYYSIANANKVLLELEAKPEMVPDNIERNLMTGELLALRAFIHFDMMRMFGLVQLFEGDYDKLAIPYLTTYDKEPAPQKSYRETLVMLEDDLDKAITLLADDPIRGNASETFMANANADGFWDARNKRMNYLAAKALKARVLLFKYDLNGASAMAQEVIDEAKACGAFTWVDADEMVHATSNDVIDWSFSSEQLFALDVSNLQSMTDQLIFNAVLSGYSSILIDKNIADNDLFNIGEGVHYAEDIRGPALMLKYMSEHYRPYKFYNNSSYYEGYRNRVPMIKISEMYMIIAEVAAEQKDKDKLTDALVEIRSHRGIQDPLGSLTLIFSSENYFISELLKEYVREFNGEGIAYYAVRRLVKKNNVFIDYDVDWSTRIHTLDAYPYPTDEVSYGRHQEL